MNIIQQLIADVRKHERFLEERDVQLKDELRQNRKTLKEVARHRERLERDHPNGEAALPLAPPDDEEEEEATDEAPEPESPAEAEPLVPGEWSPGYEVPEEDAAIDDSPMSPSEEEQYAQDLAVAEEAAKPWKPADTVESEKPIRRRKAKAAVEEVAGG
jgi:hypothetical protein